MITLETAREHLSEWLTAELRVATAQSYTIGTRQLTRANLNAIRDQIKYWQNEVATLEMAAKGRRRNRVYRVVPRDL
jgi:hypothetical protein